MECAGNGSLLIMEDAGPLCMTCADLEDLVFLPRGDAALTRRVKRRAVRFQRSWSDSVVRDAVTSVRPSRRGAGTGAR
jgi:hypothetical protein